jgi:hypothetical protein
VEIQGPALAQDLHQRGRGQRAALRGRANRVEVALGLDDDVEGWREARAGGRRGGERQTDRRARELAEPRSGRLERSGRSASAEVDDEELRAEERRMRFERER